MEAHPHVRLTARERYLVVSIVGGCTNREMARELGLTEQAVNKALAILYEKCEVRNRLDLVLFAVCHGLVSR